MRESDKTMLVMSDMLASFLSIRVFVLVLGDGCEANHTLTRLLSAESRPAQRSRQSLN